MRLMIKLIMMLMTIILMSIGERVDQRKEDDDDNDTHSFFMDTGTVPISTKCLLTENSSTRGIGSTGSAEMTHPT